MTLRVVLLDSAQDDLRELRAYLSQEFGVETWKGSYAKLKQTIRNLGHHPGIGMIPPELTLVGLSRYRQALSGMNRVVYEVTGDTVYVHLICDGRRDLGPLILRRLLRA